MTAVSDETGRDAILAEQWDILVHKDDRTSPEEYPDHCLITMEEVGDIIDAALSASPVAQEPVAWQLRQCPRVFWTSWRRCSREDYELVQKTGVFGDAPAQSRQLFPSSPPATPAGLGADEIARAALDRIANHELRDHEDYEAIQDIAIEANARILALLSRAGDQSNSTHEA